MSLPHEHQVSFGRRELQAFFADAENQLGTARVNGDRVDSDELRRFFCDAEYRVELAVSSQQEIDRKLATGFNLFDLIDPDENKLSDILADLVDPAGKHGQRDLFLGLLLEQLSLTPAPNLADITSVRREAPTKSIAKFRRRIDILVDAGSLIAIENKIDSPEQPDQVKDYRDYLAGCARQRNADCALIYLTPGGGAPGSLPDAGHDHMKSRVSLHFWSYQDDIHRWLRACRDRCEAHRVRDFLSDFIGYIETTLRPEWEETESHSNES